MSDPNFIRQDPDPTQRVEYVSPKGRAMAAGAASAATMAVLAFVMVILPPIQSGAVSLAHAAAPVVGIV